MKTLIKMIMLGVLMTSGVALGAGETTNLNFSTNTNSSNAYNGNVDNDISSNEYVAAQYNCSGTATCGGGGASGNVSGGSGDGTLGRMVEIQVPVYDYTEVTTPAIIAIAAVVVTQEDVNAGTYTADQLDMVLTPAVDGSPESVDWVKSVARDEKGVPLMGTDEVWKAYSNADAAIISSYNSANGNAKIEQTVLSAPPVAAVQINATNADMCRTGISAGGSMIGMGFTAGITLVDKNCEMIKMVRLLNNLGLKDVALALLGQDSRVAEAMLQANPDYYGRFLSGTPRNLEAESNAAETAANGKVIEHDVIDEDTPSAEGFNLIDLLTAK